ncbi:MAG: sulfatase-like hydrolase/transferase [Bacteroidia bacterium]|nr:sulfatase-like hydrolase/transferase [Bacteroidia bacterium]
MEDYKAHIKILFGRLLLLLAVFELSRLFFFILNYSQFKSISFFQAICIFFWGLRFDFASIFYFNLPFIVLHLIPGEFKNKRVYRVCLKALFILVNAVILLPNFIDSAYYHYLNKRSTADFFKLFEMGDDVPTLMPRYLKDFWYIGISWLLVMIAVWYFYPRIKKNNYLNNVVTIRHYFYQALISVFILFVFFSVARGYRLKPLRIISALDYTEAKYAPLILNTPFTILNTYNISQLYEKNFFPEKKIATIFDPVTKFNKPAEFRKLNVVIIILESFSKEYVGSLNHTEGYTPFFDSLIRRGLVFTHAFANGKRSIEAVPSILSGLPTLMNDPYISSNYSTNKINNLASLLKPEGYYSAFFHGGSNGTMGFDLFAKAAGFDEYYGRRQYNNEKDYDNNWGIYDEPFMQYFAQKINSFRQPFVTCLFTLSSHHPYSVPAKYQKKFKEGTLDIHKSIQYTDYALRKFFETASKMPWYYNTLFVLTADHTAPVTGEYYNNKVGIFSIPIAFYHPGDTALKGCSPVIIQQADIMPTILDYLNYNKPFLCFGNSAFNSHAKHFVINYLDDYYQLIEHDFTLLFDGEKTLALYDLSKDSLLTKNILHTGKKQAQEMEDRLKAIIQTYNHRMLSNKLTAE